MLRTLLLRLADREFLFLHVSHHIAWEYWSTLIWYDELALHYEAFRSGQRPSIPELPIQYGDYALWQRQWLSGAVLDELSDYWKQQLAGAPTMLPLPTDRPRPVAQTFRGARLPMELPPRLLERVRAVSRNLGVTP